MIIRTKIKAPVAFETIAFADIVVNLFVFFFVTFGLFASFGATRTGTLPIDLPKASHVQTNNATKPLTLMINRSGACYLGSIEIPLANLKTAVERELSLKKDKTILVRADRSISLERFVQVLDLLRQTSAKAVAVEAEGQSSPSGSK